MVYQRKLTPEIMLKRAWSGGYLSSRGYIGLWKKSLYLEFKAQGADEELHRFMLPLDDIDATVSRVKVKGKPATSLYIRGEGLITLMERLRPYLTSGVTTRFDTLKAEWEKQRSESYSGRSGNPGKKLE